MIRKFMIQIAKTIAKIVEKWRQYSYSNQGMWRARYFRLVLAECGKNFVVFGKPIIHEPEKIHIGNYVTINEGAQICPRSDIYIGDYVTLSRGALIISGSLDTNHWLDGKYRDHIHTEAPIHIGEGTWLCADAIVLPGVSITGKGVIVAAGAVVTQDITEDYCIAAGVPARIVKRMNMPSNG